MGSGSVRRIGRGRQAFGGTRGSAPRRREPGDIAPNRRIRPNRFELWLLIVAALAGTLVGRTAGANNFNQTDQSFKAGTNNVVFFNECNLGATIHQVFHANNDHDIAPTDINPDLVHTCIETEVRINDAEFGLSEFRGFYHCHQFFPNPQTCSISHVHINRSYSDIREDYGRTESVVCEEIGHSVGLGHLSQNSSLDSCMVLTRDLRHLSAHDKNHLNDNY